MTEPTENKSEDIGARILAAVKDESEKVYAALDKALFPADLQSPVIDEIKTVIDSVPTKGHVKIYKDLEGGWCMGNNRVFFEFNNKDWFVFGFNGKTQLVGLLIEDLEYRITLSGGGLIHCVHVRKTVNQEDQSNKLKSVDSFEIPLDHTTIPFFKLGRRPATL